MIQVQFLIATANSLPHLPPMLQKKALSHGLAEKLYSGVAGAKELSLIKLFNKLMQLLSEGLGIYFFQVEPFRGRAFSTVFFNLLPVMV